MAKQANKFIDPIEEALSAVEEAMGVPISGSVEEPAAKDGDAVVSLAKDADAKNAKTDTDSDFKFDMEADDFKFDMETYENEIKEAALLDLSKDNLLAEADEKLVAAPEPDKTSVSKVPIAKVKAPGGGIFSKLRGSKSVESEQTLEPQAHTDKVADKAGVKKTEQVSKSIPDVKLQVPVENKTPKTGSKVENNAVANDTQNKATKINDEEKLIDEQVAAIVGGADSLVNSSIKEQATLKTEAPMAIDIKSSPITFSDNAKTPDVDTTSTDKVAQNAPTKKSNEIAPKTAQQTKAIPTREVKPNPEQVLAANIKPANDDEYAGMGHALRGNQAQSSNTLFWIAALFSAVWLGLGIFAGQQTFGESLFVPSQWGAMISTPNALFLLAGIIIPIMLIWAFIVMVRRSQEMRSAVQVMTKAAQHLLEPEATSSSAVMNVGQAVRREIGAIQDTVDQALSRASELESVMHNEVSLLERSYSENEMRMRGLIEQISNEREAVVSQSERVQAVISGTHANLREDLDHTTQMISKSVGDASNVLRSTVHESQQEITSSYSNVAALFDDTFKEKTDHLIERMMKNGEGLVDKIVQTSTGAQDAFSMQANSLTDRMTMLTQEIQGGLNENLSAIDETLNLRGSALIESLETRSEKLESLLMNSQDDVSKVMDEQLTSFGLTISGKVDQVIDKMDTRTKILAENADKIDSILETRVKHVNDTLIERTRDVAGIFAQGQKSLNADIDQNIQNAGAVLEAGRDQLNQNFSENLTSISVALAAESERVNEVGSKSVAKMGEQIQGLLENAESAIAIRTDHVSTKLEKSTRDLNSMLAERTRELNKVLKEDTIPVLEGLESKGQSIASTLTDASTKIGNELDSALQRASANTDGFVAKIAESSQGVATQLNDIAFNITERSVEVVAQVDDVSKRMVENFDQATSKATTELSNVAETTNEKLVGTVETFSNQVSEGSILLSNKLEHATENASNKLTSVTEASAEKLTNVTVSAAERLASLTEGTNNKLVGTVEAFANHIAEGSHLLSSQLERATENASDKLTSATDASAAKIASATDASAEKLVSATESSVDKLTNVTEGTNDKLVGTVEAFANHVAEGSQLLSSKLERATENAAAKLSHVTEETNSKLVGTVEAFADRVSEGSNLLTSHVERVATNATENFTNSAEQLSQQLSQLNSEAGRSTEDVAARIAKTTEFLAQRLNETSQGATQQLMEASQQSVERLQNVADETLKNNQSLVSRVAESVESAVAHLSQEKHDFVEAISSQANSATVTIQNTKMALREEVTEVLERITQSNETLHSLISGTGSKLEQIQTVLDEKTLGLQNAAHQVHQTLGQATDNIGNNFEVVKATSNTIATDMANIGGRFEQHSRQLENVAELLERTQQSLSTNMGGQHEMLEQLTGGMVSKSQEMENLMRSFSDMVTEAMTKAEQGSKSLSSGLTQEFMQTTNQATEQFSRATEAMRESAREVQKELELTRTELKRGLNDLPEETKESTTALRRAVGDQIKALKELSNFVTNSGKAVDVSQGFGSQIKTASPQFGTSAQTETVSAPMTTPVSTPANASVASPSAAPTLQPQSQISSHSASPSTSMFDTAPKAPEKPLAQKEIDLGEDGDKAKTKSWMGDLLRRASGDGDEQSTIPMPSNRAPEQLIDSLNAASVDVVKALDAKTSVELWKRYLGGERDVFTRALSGVDLARTKSLIQSKYGSDNEFKSALDRYVADFEVLLNSLASQNDSAAKTRYQNSDHGRVYKILMEALGKPFQM